MKFRSSLLFILLMISATARGFTINVLSQFEGEQKGKEIDAFFPLVYSDVGITPNFVYYPSKRGLHMVNSAQLDAEATRTEIVGDTFENLVKIDASIYTLKLGFLCTHKDKCNLHAGSKIAVLKGFESATTLCSGIGLQCTFADSPNAIAKLIDKGIVDAAFSSTIETNFINCASNSPTLFFLEQKALHQVIYHYINKKHIALKAKLEAAIKKVNAQTANLTNNSIHALLTQTCKREITVL
ncbi:hypothetical protein Q4561_19185 [Alteromonas sp. 1_MG-2023]|uniref:hypothetical protein n=1 Tax=Alteromonas sp. 1_MG-2023 TaxID=3062669 RepID=UPI0026E1F820|nr:hypothetical protein [Alteromonas sp. 1_MG-2023]MDO6569202.1 hypothetical protein [Alteromonas sp. 1_MG-2023]